MNTNKVIRGICYFTNNPGEETVKNINKVEDILKKSNFKIQTKRICTSEKSISGVDNKIRENLFLSVGSLSYSELLEQLNDFFLARNVACNMELANENIQEKHVSLLFDIIKNKPDKTFNFCFVFNNVLSSPFLPSASYSQEGFALGLQPTDLSEGCVTLKEWFKNMETVWNELTHLFEGDNEFLGIDSSLAPFFGKSSLVDFINRLGMDFSTSVLTSTYMEITKFIKDKNPKPIGLCGLMIPCLEDDKLAGEYEKGNFSIERNIFLSLHCGLGIDVYPIGTDESPKKILGILQLVQSLSNKYKKPLSVRFVSDGKAKIGQKTDFQNQYLIDVVVKNL